MRPFARGAGKLAIVPLVAMAALAAWELWRGLRGPFAAEAVVTSVLLLGAGVLAAWHLASGAGTAAVRRGAWLSVLITVVLVLNCSATGVSTAAGRGYQLALAGPLTYLGVLLVLLGPLLAALIAPALLVNRPRAAALASIVSAVLALVTAEAALITSFSGYCSRFSTAAAVSACVTAASGAVAGIFGLFGVLLVLPFATQKPAPDGSPSVGPEPSQGGLAGPGAG
jgi:hypothetical protein